MEGLGAAVETLHDSHFLNTVLFALGQTHHKRNIRPCMLKVSARSTSHQQMIVDIESLKVLTDFIDVHLFFDLLKVNVIPLHKTLPSWDNGQ